MNDKIVEVRSAIFTTVWPGSFFEWHPGAKKLYVYLPDGSESMQDSINKIVTKVARQMWLITEDVKTKSDVTMAIRAFANGFVHGRANPVPQPPKVIPAG